MILGWTKGTQTIIWVHLWCIKKDERAATCKLCKKNINIESTGFAVLKQHSEKLKYQGFSAHLSQSLTGHETDPEAGIGIAKYKETIQQPERKAQQSV